MSRELKSKKIDDNTLVLHDKLTNDPVAIIKRKKSAYANKSVYSAEWHPDMKQMYPDETNSFTQMNIQDADSASSISNHVSGAYDRLLSPGIKDPMRIEHAGTITKNYTQGTSPSVPVEFNQYHVFDNDSNHVANINVKKHLSKHIGTRESNIFNRDHDAHIEFIGQQPTDDQKQILATKNKDIDPLSLLKRVHHWQTLKNVEPRFVGSHYTSDGNSKHHVYTTKLSPTDATSEYVKHLQSQDSYSGHTFEQMSPTFVKATHKDSVEFIDGSTPGKINHMTMKTYPADSYKNNKLFKTIE